MKSFPRPRRIFTAASTGVLIAAVLAACGSTGSTGTGSTTVSSTPKGSPIIIGNVGDYSGVYSSSSSIDTKDGFLAWAKWINAKGGINGHPVQVIVKDDQGNPAQAVAAVKELVQIDHVVAFAALADYTTDSTYAAYLDAKHIPVIGGQAYSLTWTTSPMFFPLGTTLVDNIHAQSYMAQSTGATKWGYFVCGEAPVCKQTPVLNQALSVQLGMKIVYVGGALAASSSYTGICVAAKDSGATAVDIAVIINEAFRIVDTCLQQGYHPHWIIADSLANQTEAKNAAFDGAVGYTTVFPFYLKGAGTADYLAALAAYGQAPDQGNAMGWVSGLALVKALATATSAKVTSAQIVKGLYAFHGETLGGLIPPTTYNPGKPASPQPCFYKTAIVNGAFTSSTGLKAFCPAT
jgi:branched-chain amino acid transport system substrate-binding protein